MRKEVARASMFVKLKELMNVARVMLDHLPVLRTGILSDVYWKIIDSVSPCL